MGYTSGHPCMFSLDMKQTPENVRKVLDIAGWNVVEAAREAGISGSDLFLVVERDQLMPDDQWRKLLDKAGRRAFDWDEGSE
jgi:hypothetical protein